MPPSGFNVPPRKVPLLALLPRGHFTHGIQASTKSTSSMQDENHKEKVNETKDRSRVTKDPLTAKNVQHDLLHCKSDAADEQKANDNTHSERRLGERFLNMMALMTRLSMESLEDKSLGTAGIPVTHDNGIVQTEQFLIKSPQHVVRPVAKQTMPKFNLCMLPSSNRQSLLHSPIRRKGLRKRRRKERRARRKWETSHASWPRHASVGYVVNHSRHESADGSGACLLKLLEEIKINVDTRN